MITENKVTVYAPIEVQQNIEKAALEKASFLAFPEEKQNDLQYIRSVLVSAGTNRNGAHFLPSEMMKAHNTIVNKAIDIEHDEEKIIGHIYDCAFLYKDGEQFDPLNLMAEYEEVSKDLDDLDIDVAIAGVIHKMRFPDISEEIASGDWKVSMECFFKDFDIKIGDTIITRDEAQSLGYDPNELIGGFVKVVAGQKALGKHFVARVLRKITFSGMGIVKDPANPHSIIMETAAHREMMDNGNRVIDLERIDNLRGHKVELSSLDQNKEVSEVGKSAETVDDLLEINLTSEKDGNVEFPKLYIELNEKTGGIQRIITVSPNQEVAARWSGGGLPGPGSIQTQVDSICKSFKKRYTKFNALDQSEAQVIQEHYCALFEEPCPVVGASAKAPECLRNIKNSFTKDPEDTTVNKTLREHIEDSPSNTFTTILHRSIALENMQKRKKQIDRIREEAQSLRNSLREYELEVEKKTLK